VNQFAAEEQIVEPGHERKPIVGPAEVEDVDAGAVRDLLRPHQERRPSGVDGEIVALVVHDLVRVVRMIRPDRSWGNATCHPCARRRGGAKREPFNSDALDKVEMVAHVPWTRGRGGIGSGSSPASRQRTRASCW
jgi:hypothetical protein